jgi:CHAT domain-containing protein
MVGKRQTEDIKSCISQITKPSAFCLLPSAFSRRELSRVLRFVLSMFLGLILFFNLSVAARDEPSTYYNYNDPVKIARQYYDLGNFLEAAKILEIAVKDAQKKGELLLQIQIMNLLSLTQQKLGNWQVATKLIDRSLSLLEETTKTPAVEKIEAQIFNTKGSLELATGKVKQALESWQKAESDYKNVRDSQQGVVGSRLNQAEALESLGFYRLACNRILQTFPSKWQKCEEISRENLEEIFKAIATNNSSLTSFSYQSLGNALLSVGKLPEARIVLEASKQFPGNKEKVWLSLGNVYKALGSRAKDLEDLTVANKFNLKAIEYYQQVTRSIQSPQDLTAIVKLQAQLNQLNLLITLDRVEEAKKLLSQIDLKKLHLPTNRSLVYAKINLAQNLALLIEKKSLNSERWQEVVSILEAVNRDAIELGDKRSQSYALGILGKISYEHNLSSFSSSQQLLEQALKLAQAIVAPEIAYQWEWQLGRIYKNQSSRQAIVAYQGALNDLQSSRNDLAALNREIQFSFKERVEPVYRELVELLLSEERTNIADRQKNFQDARDAIEILQVAELDNYFKDACASLSKQPIESLDPTAATIYTIALPKKLEVIVSLPDGTFLHHTNFITSAEVEQTLKQLQQYLKEPDRLKDVQKLSKTVYDWLINPFVENLELASDRQESQIKTLVFVLDGLLKNIPMSVLYDGNKYLIERYAIAVTPGLKLLKTDPKQPSERLETLITGISQKIVINDRQFISLREVEDEVQKINSIVPGETLLNSNLTKENLQRKIDSKPFSLVHIATHGQFSSNPDKTFILLWNELLDVQAFNNLFLIGSNYGRKLIDILVLSACETALGDRRAALGLAGIAVRAGTRSTLGTLWQVNDESTSQVTIEFYRALRNNPSMNKAEALRQAQLKLWKNRDRDWQVPYFWAAYVFVGDWR